MNGYERIFYERDVPQAVKALKEIAAHLETLTKVIVSDPGDEIEHITESYPGAGYGYRKRKKSDSNPHVNPKFGSDEWVAQGGDKP